MGNNLLFIDADGLQDELTPEIPIEQITLTVNPTYRYGKKLSDDEWSVEQGFPEELETRFREDTMQELVSYAVGCAMGRYSLDEPGLIYAHSGNQGFDPRRYRSFPADADGILPITDTDWFDDVQMVGGDERWAHGRTAIAKSARYTSPVPLKTFGDGVNRLFGIILSLCNARNGVLLVDEVENGLHYSVQSDIWRTLFRLARDLNVQVFATSHSWDCVRAFQEAAQESPEAGVLVRLANHNDKIVPTLSSEHELAIVTRDQIEVR